MILAMVGEDNGDVDVKDVEDVDNYDGFWVARTDNGDNDG